MISKVERRKNYNNLYITTMNTKHLVNIFLCFVYSAVIAHSVETRTAVLSGTNEVEQIAKAQDKASATTIFENTRKMAE